MQPAGSSSGDANRYVLDTNALLAYLGAEQGGERVSELLALAMNGRSRLYMCVVNLGEVAYIEERERGLAHAEHVLAIVGELPLEVIDADRKLTLAAARLKAVCPIAYADCFAAALAQARNATLVTGDPELRKLKDDCGVRVEWLV